MAHGRKTGGRTKGTPNRKTKEIGEILAGLKCDPIAGMATIAMDDKNSVELRARMFTELAPYLYPKRKAIELSAEEDNRIEIVWPGMEGVIALRRAQVEAQQTAGRQSDSIPNWEDHE